jgi:hypothetical protein
MKWFFAYNGNRPPWYEAHLLAMIRSAVANTSLDGYLIYFDLHEKKDDPIVAFAESHQITVIRRKPSILEDLQRIKAKFPDFPFGTASGTYLRIDVPMICSELGFSDEFVIYTDCDVIFLDDVSRQADQPFFQPRFLSAGPEFFVTDWKKRNAGVMVVNVVSLLDDFAAFREWITSGDTMYELLFKRGAHDQTAYEFWYAGRQDKLPVEYNWRPYWGFNEEAQIVHFHGPKADGVRRMLNGETDRLRPLWPKLFGQAPEAYRKYLAIFEEYEAV